MKRRHLVLVVSLVAALATASWLIASPRSSGSDHHAPAARASSHAQAPAVAGSVRQPAPRAHRKPEEASLRTASRQQSLPPEGVPLVQVYDELDARAANGDKPAASRLYRDLLRCRSADGRIASGLVTAKYLLSRKSDTLNDHTLDYIKRRLHDSDQLEALCNGLTPAMRESLTPVTLRAARLGDADARDCYVNRGPNLDKGTLLKHPEWLQTYTREVPALIDAAIADGDWKMVDMLQYAYGLDGRNLVSGFLGHDAEQHYRYLKLFSLGEDSDSASFLDARLESAADVLTAEQIADADAWALKTYQQHFQGASNEAAPRGWNACAVPHP